VFREYEFPPLNAAGNPKSFALTSALMTNPTVKATAFKIKVFIVALSLFLRQSCLSNIQQTLSIAKDASKLRLPLTQIQTIFMAEPDNISVFLPWPGKEGS